MADSFFLKTLLSKFNGGWYGGFKIAQEARQAAMALDAAFVQPSWQFKKTTDQLNVGVGDSLISWDSTTWTVDVTDNRVAASSIVITIAGKYLITAGCPMTCGTANQTMGLKLVINGASSFTLGGAELGRAGAVIHANGSVIVQLAVNDIITVVANSSSSTADLICSAFPGHFSGIRIGA